MKRIFLISGKAQHGKDSVAKFLKDKLDGKVLNMHNADYLKMIASQYLGWDGNKDDFGRTLLQWLGTERVRLELQKPLFWVNSVCDAIEIVQEKYDYFTVSDCRFPNEIFLQKARFPNMVTTIKVVRDNFDNGLSEQQKRHLSETSLDDFNFDYTIHSDGNDINSLEKQVDLFIEKYITERESTKIEQNRIQ